jgi:hypothetical protein
MRARIAQKHSAWWWARNECWRSQNWSRVARSSSRPRLRPVAPRPERFDCRKHRAAVRLPRPDRAPCAIPSRQSRTAPPCAHVQIHTSARTSVECSGCEQTRERIVVCRRPFVRTAQLRLTLTLGRSPLQTQVSLAPDVTLLTTIVHLCDKRQLFLETAHYFVLPILPSRQYNAISWLKSTAEDFLFGRPDHPGARPPGRLAFPGRQINSSAVSIWLFVRLVV